MLTFWVVLKSSIFMYELLYLVTFWATFGNFFGYFIFQHLVTLKSSKAS